MNNPLRYYQKSWIVEKVLVKLKCEDKLTDCVKIMTTSSDRI